MDETAKKFDGVFWEWKGRRVIRGLKPICPKCQYELDITESGPEMTLDPLTITFPQSPVSYSCPKCSFCIKTTIRDVDSPKDLLKAAMKEFEQRQRLKESDNTKD